MEAMIEKCAGLDVHQETIVACILYGPLEKRPKKKIESFSTTTSGLLKLQDWLSSQEVTDVVMESTGIYWKPVWNILEGDFHLVLANAKHVKNVPGRKTDISDSMWLASLLRIGVLKASFIPEKRIRHIRELVTLRKSYTRSLFYPPS